MKVHFVGIGGIGVSAIARMKLADGAMVTGSDRDRSPVTTELEKLGAKIFYGHAAGNVPDGVDLVVYTVAISADNPELVRAHELGATVKSYPEILGEVSREKFTIAVAGTHGKTTTTAMIVKIFIDAGLDPTVIIGSHLLEQGSNFVAGKSKYLIVEADEYRRAFLNLWPKILVITNIASDHLDYYRNLDEIRSAFVELSARAERVITETEYGKVEKPIVLKFPGEHNQRNAQAAIAVAMSVGIDEKQARRSLENFAGTWRRFEFKGKTKTGALVYDDYAHNPDKVRAALAGAREAFPKQKIIAVFQPHLYSRTKLLFKDFAKSFTDANKVIITDIYAAREQPDPEVSGRKLAEAAGGRYLPLERIADFLLKNAGAGDVIMLMGAGDIYRLAEALVQ